MLYICCCLVCSGWNLWSICSWPSGAQLSLYTEEAFNHMMQTRRGQPTAFLEINCSNILCSYNLYLDDEELISKTETLVQWASSTEAEAYNCKAVILVSMLCVFKDLFQFLVQLKLDHLEFYCVRLLVLYRWCDHWLSVTGGYEGTGVIF